MNEIHIEKRSYDGYCVGTGIEHPGIIVWAKSDEELIELFKTAVPAHEEALKTNSVDNRSLTPHQVTVIPVDRGVDK